MATISRLKKEKRRAENKNDTREVASLCNLLGVELQAIGDFEGALEQHQHEAGLCASIADEVGVAVAHRRMGEVYGEMGNYSRAVHHQTKHLTLARKAGSIVEEQRALATLGRTHLQRAEGAEVEGRADEASEALKEAERAFLKSLVTCEQLVGVVEPREHGQMLARLYLNLGLVLDQRENAAKGTEFIQQALDLCVKHGFNEDGYRCHYALASTRYKTSQLVVALHHITKALQLAKKLHEKSFETDCLNFMGQIHVANEDLQAAKKSFYKLYKLQKVSSVERAKATKKLKTIVSMCLAEDALVVLGEFHQHERMKNYEKLGDGFSFFDCYSHALRYYHLMLDIALKLEKAPSDLVPIYVSLARTYQDVKKYTEAKEFYEKELEVHLVGDPKEACKTLMNLAVVQELMGLSYMDLSVQYERARSLAQRASDVKLEAEVLRLHKALSGIPSSDLRELEDALEDLIKANDLDPEGGISEDEAFEESEDEVDLNDIAFSDSDEENLSHRRSRRGGQKTGMWKRNQKGETALHTACIDGNVVMVRKLIQQGHPINPRDNCGWLPLHEACNYGYIEIVELLLDAGAHINDRGGAQCNGITPLHDAASCGNLVVMKLLISKGASLISKNDNGEVPLTCLVSFRQRASLTPKEERECIEFEEELKAAMVRAGHEVPIQTSPTVYPDSSRGPRKARSRTVNVSTQLHNRRSPEHENDDTDDELPDLAELQPSGKTKLPSRGVVSDNRNSDSEDEAPSFRNPLLENVQQTTSACEKYASAINRMGSASRLLQKCPSSSVSPKEPISALLSKDDDVGDDWLVDDLGLMNRKRKRQNRFDFDYHETRKERKSSPTDSGFTTTSKRERKLSPVPSLATTSTSHSIPSSSSSSRHQVKGLNKPRQIKLTSLLQRSSDTEGESSSSRAEPFTSDTSSTPVREAFESESPSGNEDWGQTIGNVSKVPSSSGVVNGVPRSAASRVRVHVKKHVLLVPVAADCMGRTVDWLAKEAATRYYQLSGLRPTLSLNTKDGAVLHPDDPLSLALSGSHDEELHAEVQGWDLQPLPQRYTEACKSRGCAHVRVLAAALQEAESSGNLELMGRASRIGLSTLQPMLRALQWQQALQSIIIPHVRMGDEGAKLLLEALPTLPFLRVLDLSNCRITVNTLTALAHAIQDGDVQLKNLASLELSHNSLTGITSSTLEALLTLPSLASFSLKHCGLNLKEDFDIRKTSPALRSLALDHNCVEEIALTRLLTCTPRLASLTLSGTHPENRLSEGSGNSGKAGLTKSWGLGTAIAKVLGEGSECCLEHLDISSCCLSDDDVVELTTYLYRCTSLTWLSLAHNPEVSTTSLASLVSEVSASSSVPPVTTLFLHGCAPVSTPGHSFLDALLRLIHRRAHVSFKALSKLSVCISETSGVASMLSQAWNDAHTTHAQTTTVGNQVFLHRDDNEFPGIPP